MRTSMFMASNSQHTDTNLTELSPLMFQVAVLMSVLGRGMRMVGVRLRVGRARADEDVSEKSVQAGQLSRASGVGEGVDVSRN
jgi:hypothetical protein